MQNGYLTEELFVVECLKRNIPVSRPIFNVESYDFIVEINNVFISVQVKKSYIEGDRRRACLKSSYVRSDIRKYVSESNSVDFLAVYDEECDDWYIIPKSIIPKCSIQISREGKYAKYIDNFIFSNN